MDYLQRRAPAQEMRSPHFQAQGCVDTGASKIRHLALGTGPTVLPLLVQQGYRPNRGLARWACWSSRTTNSCVGLLDLHDHPVPHTRCWGNRTITSSRQALGNNFSLSNWPFGNPESLFKCSPNVLSLENVAILLNSVAKCLHSMSNCNGNKLFPFVRGNKF